ncbi:MAG: hypothetical protein N5P05_002707 [Chroococcopsis gigantea SAG 12.99]|jgi:hypothetical protein|nr:hypothetical protein [Chlorogloea purpurea SAG 13.99]MDV3001101.1 hypothetical protein [Chroococcopsis gigantea SAG 12.99]
MQTNTLNFKRLLQSARNLPPIVSPDYRWRVLEFFCDGYLAYQQTPDGVHYQALVSPAYRPHTIVIAFDGTPVFALDGNEVVLDRLVAPLELYQSKPL